MMLFHPSTPYTLATNTTTISLFGEQEQKETRLRKHGNSSLPPPHNEEAKGEQ
jgi:hypothetical protein